MCNLPIHIIKAVYHQLYKCTKRIILYNKGYKLHTIIVYLSTTMTGLIN